MRKSRYVLYGRVRVDFLHCLLDRLPGVVAVGFLVNVPVISQTSTAVCLGPVVIPLMRSAGYSMVTIGACLLLGVSVGGELLNPGAPELLAVFDKTEVPPTEQARRYLPPVVLTQFAVSAAVLWLFTLLWERGNRAGATAEPTPEPPADEPPEHIDLLKAMVPLVPLGLLFASGLPAPYKLFEVPDAWVTLPKGGQRDPAYGSRLIGLAMLVGVGAAMAATPSKSRACVKQFFDGAGYGFANIISLIVTANCFGAAIRGSELAAELGRVIQAFPRSMEPLAAFVPLAFAAVSGSGMASTQSLYGFFHSPAVALGLDPTAVGALRVGRLGCRTDDVAGGCGGADVRVLDRHSADRSGEARRPAVDDRLNGRDRPAWCRSPMSGLTVAVAFP